MAKPPPRAPVEKLELHEKLVATNPLVDRKGASNPYTLVNGHMFSQLLPSGRLSLRLPVDERDAFLKTYETKLVEQYGVKIKEDVEVPDQMLENTAELKRYFDISCVCVSSLKPKPTTRKKT